MNVKLNGRMMKKVSDLNPGDTFIMVGKPHDVCMVIDLTKTDMFTSPLSLRDDVKYFTWINSGVIAIIPKGVEVEVVNIEGAEISNKDDGLICIKCRDKVPQDDFKLVKDENGDVRHICGDCYRRL